MLPKEQIFVANLSFLIFVFFFLSGWNFIDDVGLGFIALGGAFFKKNII
jgi:hypothetical protein